MSPVGWIGLFATVIGLVVILLTLVLILSSLLSLRRKARVLQAALLREGIEVGKVVSQLREIRAERDELGRPWRRARRWVTHPLTIALISSYRRRRRRA